MRGHCLLVLVCIALLMPCVVHAATCTVATNTFNFGNYDPMSAAPTTMTVDLSTGSSGSYFPRAMNTGTDTLTYNLYTTASLTTVWGNGTGGTGDIVQTFKNKSTTIFNVYGQITAQQNVIPGSYSDSITVTVGF